MRYLNWHGEHPAETLFAEMADYIRTHPFEADLFGKGAALQAFEARIASLMGMEAATFMPSGVMAQQVALRIWADRSGCGNVGLHPSNHVEVNEHRAYAHLHNLTVKLLGGKNSPTLAKDLRDCAEPLGTLLIELPLRRIGGILPSWTELQELMQIARKRGIHLHLDGARIWESQVYYDRPFPEICCGFDSVYVSFYKGLGAFAGAMLLGSAEFIAEARIWQRRHGGNLVTILPLAVSAQLNFEKRIEKMKLYRERALSLASALKSLEDAIIKPAPPQVNMFHLFLHAPLEKLEAANKRIMEEDGFKICTFFLPSDIPEWTYTEIVAGDAMLDLGNDEIVAAFRKLIETAK
jgi:threonine aldolase